MRDVLIAHIDGPTPVTGFHTREYLVTVRSLLARGLLATDFSGDWGRRSKRYGSTFITDTGRKALAWLLADWADAVTRAGTKGMSSAQTAALDAE